MSVTAMGVVMNQHADPDASPTLTAGFAVFTAVFAALSIALYRPLLAAPATGPKGRSRARPGGPAHPPGASTGR